MRISLKVIIYLMTAIVRLSSVTGNKGGLDINYWNDITPVAKNHSTGDSVQIECTKPDSRENNEKFLCKGANPFNCNQLINTTEQERDGVKGRFHIRDNRKNKYFYVYINNLSTDDSGYYWCGSSRKGQHAGYTKILLSVEHITTKRSDPPALQATESSTTRNVLHSDLIAIVVVCLALLLILVLVFILCKHKLSRTQVCCATDGSSEQRTNYEHSTEKHHGDHHYDEIQMLNQQASSGDALLSVYATVNLPADQLHYASVNFQKDSVTISTEGNAPPDTDKNRSSTCEYSSISRSQGDTHNIDVN